MILILLFFSLCKFGAAGLQCLTAADDRRPIRDGPRHLTDKSVVHGWSAGR